MKRLAVEMMSVELRQPGAHAGALMNSTEELVARVRAGDEEAFRLIFDRYSRRGVIPQAYIENVVRYVKKGGAFLEAAGPSFGTPATSRSSRRGSSR